MNRVKLYSNGTGVFDRAYRLKSRETLHISIPIRNDSLDETIASIGVFGDVTLTDPPSYTPIGIDATNLSIDAYNVMSDLATKLRGAQVSLRVASETVSGRLAGIQKSWETVDQKKQERHRIALFDAQGALRTFAEQEVLSLTFTEERVQAEIDKALQRAFETIKPNSTFVNLTLASSEDDETEAHVQYAVARLGAWKISYRLRGDEQGWRLEGHAIVDNSTDEPWEDCLISVITGEPVSFATDLAEIRLVRRNKINVVADEALDALTLEEASVQDLFGVTPSVMTAGGVAAPALAASAGRHEATLEFATPVPAQKRAIQQMAEKREVGDAVEYTAPYAVSIGANRSAILPMFDVELKEPDLLLIYKEERHAVRPYRAFRFTNNTKYSLGRGVCTLFQQGAYIGKAILEATQPGQERTLPYALESGVRIFTEQGRSYTHRAGIQILRGAVVCELVQIHEEIYRIQNNKAEPFRFEIEHTRQLYNSTFEIRSEPKAEITQAAIPSGVRIGFDLPTKGAQAVTVMETHVFQQEFILEGSGGAQWLTSLLATSMTIGQEPAVRRCLERQQALDEAKQALADAEQQITEILEEQERLKGLLKVGGHEGDANEWRSTLAENERKIKAAKSGTLPQRRQAVQQAEQKLQQSLSALSLTWIASNEDETENKEHSE